METFTIKICGAPKPIRCYSAIHFLTKDGEETYITPGLISTNDKATEVKSCKSNEDCPFMQEGSLKIQFIKR